MSNINVATYSQHLTSLATSILSNRRENRTGSVTDTLKEADAGLDPVDTDTDGRGSDGDEEASEIQEIFESIADSINSLFRFSIIIRNNTNRDRYAKAAIAAAGSLYDDKYDTNHVREKFPALEKGKEWLIARLGKAITTRRQYLRYCREHHLKLARQAEETLEQEDAYKEALAPMATRALTAAGLSSLSKPTSTLAPTQASTLMMLNPGQTVEEDSSEEAQSQTSYATSHEEDPSSSKLHVVPLEEVSKGLKHFECPYCFQIQAITTQKAWK